MKRALALLGIIALMACGRRAPVAARPTGAPIVAGTASVSVPEVPSPTPTLVPILPYFFASDIDGDGDIYMVDQDGQLRNLTDNKYPDWDPALSRDGSRVAYASRRDGNSEIYVMDLRSGYERNVTNNPAYDYEPDWSPDASHLVFVSERDGGRDIYTLDLAHSVVRRLSAPGTGMCRSPAWSPDGGYIAYSCVRNGIENIYLLELGGTERQITQWPLKGRFPTWSEDGSQLAFAGWHDDDRPGIYVASIDGREVYWLWEARDPIRSLVWADTNIIFSMARGSHDLYVLDSVKGGVRPLVTGPGWEDSPAARGEGVPAALELSGEADEAYVDWVPPVLGVNIADLSNAYLVREMGFGWMKNYLSWAGVEPEPAQFRWEDPDNVVEAAEQAGLQLLLRIHEVPAWVRPEGSTPTYPPGDLDAYARFMREVAARYRGRVAAYEIWNEPNLFFEWGLEEPDPDVYALMLCRAYSAIKSVDPSAIVVSGGVATTGDGGEGAMGDLEFIGRMYEAGARHCFDVLGSHPYGHGRPPFQRHEYGLSVARLEEQHEVMEAHGDASKAIWATETGWPIASPWSMGEHDQFAVDETLQAFYYQQMVLTATYHWPWLQGIFLFNLDFSTAPWYESRQPMRWYAILEGDGSPRLAFSWLSQIRADHHE